MKIETMVDRGGNRVGGLSKALVPKCGKEKRYKNTPLGFSTKDQDSIHNHLRCMNRGLKNS